METSKCAPRIIIVDDDYAIMQCVGQTLQQTEGIEVLGYARHPQAGAALAVNSNPDLVLMDTRMPAGDPFYFADEITRHSHGRTKVLFYTDTPSDYFLDRCLSVRAAGMVSRHGETLQELAHAIRYVLEGYQYYSADLQNRIRNRDTEKPSSPLSELTPRDIEVIRLLAQGNTNQEVANTMNLSLRSIEKAISDMKTKLSIRTTNQLLIYAAREGAVCPELIKLD